MTRVRRRQMAKVELARFSVGIMEQRFKDEAEKGKGILMAIAEAGNERFAQVEKLANERLAFFQARVEEALKQSPMGQQERQALKELVRNYNQYAQYLQKIIDREYEMKNIFDQNYYSAQSKNPKPTLSTWIVELL